MADPTPPPETGTDLSLLDKFPVLIIGAATLVVTALLNVLISFGVPISADNADKLGKLVDALGGVVLLVMLYRKVTSNAKVINRVTNTGEVVAGEAAIEPTGSTVQLAASPVTGLAVPLSTVNPRLVTQAIAIPAPDPVRGHGHQGNQGSQGSVGNRGSFFD